MGKENQCPKCVEKINALITNKDSGFTEDDREWLNNLTEAQLDKLTPKVVEKEKIVEKTVEVNKLSPEDQEAIAYGRKQREDRRKGLISGILTNTEKDTWSEDILKSMSDDTLERILNSVKKKEEDYSVAAGSVLTNVADVEPLPPTGITFETKK